jgi:hypothetical protein
MTLIERFALTFRDSDGSIAMPEVVATVGALNCIVCPFIDWIRRGDAYPIATVGAVLMGLVWALASAQRIRDGLPVGPQSGADR